MLLTDNFIFESITDNTGGSRSKALPETTWTISPISSAECQEMNGPMEDQNITAMQ